MEFFLVRHAIAVERTSTMEDAARPLTERGARRFARAVRGLERLELRLDHVFHSPWLRARQTAELLAPITAGGVEVTELLADDPGEELLALAGRFSDSSRIAFVGHEPWMGELLSLLLTGTTRFAEKFLFKKGGLAWTLGDPRPGKMSLVCMFTPKSLRRMGEAPEPAADTTQADPRSHRD